MPLPQAQRREQQQHATLRMAPGQLPGVLHLIIMSGCDQPHQRAQAPSHESNTSQLVGVPLPKTAVRDFKLHITMQLMCVSACNRGGVTKS